MGKRERGDGKDMKKLLIILSPILSCCSGLPIDYITSHGSKVSYQVCSSDDTFVYPEQPEVEKALNFMLWSGPEYLPSRYPTIARTLKKAEFVFRCDPWQCKYKHSGTHDWVDGECWGLRQGDMYTIVYYGNSLGSSFFFHEIAHALIEADLGYKDYYHHAPGYWTGVEKMDREYLSRESN